MENENDLLTIFGEPYAIDNHYENWLSAASYLAYGGSLRIVRSNNNLLRNSFVGSASSVKIDSLDHYNSLGYNESTLTGVVFSARNPGSWANGIRVAIIDGRADQILSGLSTSGVYVGYGITQSVSGKSVAGIGQTSPLNGYLKGIITGVGQSSIDVKVLSHVSVANTESNVDYQQSGVYSFTTGSVVAIHTNGYSSPFTTASISTSIDWFDQQTIGLTTSSSISWNSIAPRPSTTAYCEERNSRFDEIHVVVIDGLGSITGNSGTILEKHLSLSKATDAVFSVGNPSYWRTYPFQKIFELYLF